MDTSAAVPTSSASPMAAAHGGGSPGTPSSAGENSTGGESLGIKMRGRIAHSITEMGQKAKIAQKADGNLELQGMLMDACDEWVAAQQQSARRRKGVATEEQASKRRRPRPDEDFEVDLATILDKELHWNRRVFANWATKTFAHILEFH